MSASALGVLQLQVQIVIHMEILSAHNAITISRSMLAMILAIRISVYAQMEAQLQEIVVL